MATSRLMHPSGVDCGPSRDGREQKEGRRRRLVWSVGGLLATTRDEAAGLLEPKRGANMLYTFPPFFFCFLSPGVGSVSG